jgi:hypothetical protein
MTPRQIRAVRVAERFMPRLWDFSYPCNGRGFKRSRRVAFRAWVLAFRLRVQLLDV